MDIEIQLGSPRFSCDRFGICRMDSAKESKYIAKEGKALATLHLLADFSFVLRFYRKSINPATYEKHFANALFTVSVTAVPSGNVFTMLGIPTFEIKEGQYPIKITKTHLEVKIQYSATEKNASYSSCVTFNSS
jgi:hypothetical protein